MTTPPRSLFLLAMAFAAAACGSQHEQPSAPSAPPTPRPAPSPALIVVTAERTPADMPRPASLSLYTIAADGRLVLAGTPQPIGPLTGVYAASYVPATGLYRQLVVDEPRPSRSVPPVRIETYTVDQETAVFTRIGAEQAPSRSNAVAFHPNGRFLYASIGGQQLDGYELDSANGALLRRIPGAPFTWAAPIASARISLAPSGRFGWGTGRIPDGYHSNNGYVVSFALDAATGAVTAFSDARIYDQSSSLALTTREDAAYILDRWPYRSSRFTWHRFALDASGSLDDHEMLDDGWGAPYSCFTRSDRHLLSLDTSRLYLVSIAPDGRTEYRTDLRGPRADYWDARRVLLEIGRYVYVGADRSIAVVRLDEDAGTLEPVQEVTPGDTLEILAVARALPPG